MHGLFTVILNKLLLGGNALLEGLFLQRVGLPGHCGLVGGHFHSLEQNPVSADLHTCGYLDDVSNEGTGLVVGGELSSSVNRNQFSGISHFVQFLELLLFLVVVHSGDSGR